MKDYKQVFNAVRKYSFIVAVVLIGFAVMTNALIMLSPVLNEAGFPYVGTFAMLFDYSHNAGHSMKLLGQFLSNLAAYIFMLSGLVVFVLSLILIKHDIKTKISCAVLGLLLFFPAILGLTGGVVDFFAHGFAFLNTHKSLETALIMGGVFITLLLDVAFLIMAYVTMIDGIKTAVKVNKGEVKIEEAKAEEKPVVAGESDEERVSRILAEREVILNRVEAMMDDKVSSLESRVDKKLEDVKAGVNVVRTELEESVQEIKEALKEERTVQVVKSEPAKVEGPSKEGRKSPEISSDLLYLLKDVLEAAHKQK